MTVATARLMPQLNAERIMLGRLQFNVGEI